MTQVNMCLTTVYEIFDIPVFRKWNLLMASWFIFQSVGYAAGDRPSIYLLYIREYSQTPWLHGCLLSGLSTLNSRRTIRHATEGQLPVSLILNRYCVCTNLTQLYLYLRGRWSGLFSLIIVLSWELWMYERSLYLCSWSYLWWIIL